jgi:hypothetical protein
VDAIAPEGSNRLDRRWPNRIGHGHGARDDAVDGDQEHGLPFFPPLVSSNRERPLY